MKSIDDKYLRSWRKKPLLRKIYRDFHDRISAHCRPGRTLEIGCGIGQFNHPNMVRVDILFGGCDVVADAQRLPFASSSFDNIVMVDVLHHVKFPMVFFNEARRILKPTGKLIMVEPAITLGSTLFYRLFHDEPVQTHADPFFNPAKANQAIPTLIIKRRLPLKLRYVEWFSFLTYPLSGGFKRWQLIPTKFAPLFLRLEQWLRPLGRWLAFRMLIVMENAGCAIDGCGSIGRQH